MKKFTFSWILAIVTSTSAFAAPSAVIEKKVKILGNIAYSYSVEKVQGETPRELMRALAEKRGVEEFDENFQAKLPAKDVVISDRSSWASLTLSQAQEIFSQMEVKTDEDGNETPKDKAERNAQVAEAIINELADLGMKFGLTDNSSGYCGVSFGGLLVIDVEKGKIYEIALTPSGTC